MLFCGLLVVGDSAVLILDIGTCPEPGGGGGGGGGVGPNPVDEGSGFPAHVDELISMYDRISFSSFVCEKSPLFLRNVRFLSRNTNENG